MVAAAAWEHLLAGLDPANVDLDTLFPDPETRRDTVLAAFAELDPSGARGEECWRDYEAEADPVGRARPDRRAALADWDRHRAVVEVLVDPRTLGAGLVAAGAAARFADLDPAVDDETARWAVATATSCATGSPSSTCSTCWAGGPRGPGPSPRCRGAARRHGHPRRKECDDHGATRDLVIGIDCSTTAAKAVVWDRSRPRGRRGARDASS